MALKVIGTGFGRTGTDSMRRALNMLGFGPTHHMFEVLDNPEQKAMWRDAVHRGFRDWDRLFDGFESCVDWPSALFWEDLIEVYPDAKVLLTWRSAESWWGSFSRTILPVVSKGEEPDSVGEGLMRIVFGGLDVDKDGAIRAYEDNVAKVKATVPADRLLIHGLGDGWEPLCDFLGCAVPDMPYPSGNNTDDFHETVAGRRS